MHCTDLVGRPEHLYRALAYLMDGEREVYNDGPPTRRNLTVPREFLQLPSLLYTVSVLYCVQKDILCRSNLCSGYVCQVVFESWLEVDRHLEHLDTDLHGAEAASGREARWCNDTLLFLLAPFV